MGVHAWKVYGMAEEQRQGSATSGIDPEEVLRKAGPYSGESVAVDKPLLHGSDVEIAQRLALRLRMFYRGNVVFCEGEFYGYTGKCWEAMEEHVLRKYVHEWDGRSVAGSKSVVGLSSGRVNSILKEAAVVLTVNDWFAGQRRGINCQNGLVEFGEGDWEPRLVPHDPRHRKRHVLNAEWHGPRSIEGSMLERLVTAPFKGDPEGAEKIALIGEVAGSAAMGWATRLVEPKALVMFGEGANNGKSRLIELCRGVLPESAVGSVSPMNFEDPTYRITLVGKLLNTSDELGTEGVISGEIFKFLVTGNPVQARDLYKPTVTFKSMAQHIFSCNSLPTIQGGMDKGVLRRLGMLGFNRVIPEAERVADITERVLRDEMPLVLSFVVDGAARLLRQGKFTEPDSSVDLLLKWARETDTVLGWLDERVVQAEKEARLQTSIAYNDYDKWVRASGRKPVSQRKFSQRMEGAGYKSEKSGGWRGFHGIKLDTLHEVLSREIDAGASV
jgi:P4 family phage/plasmid primase-like protien